MFKFLFVIFFFFILLVFLMGFSILRTFKNIFFGSGNSTRKGDKSTQTFTMTPTQAGTYTIVATFRKYVYDGKKWVYSEGDDVKKSITFKANESGTSSSTSGSGSSSSSSSGSTNTAAKTGDTTPVVPVAAALVVSGAALALTLKKRKKEEK